MRLKMEKGNECWKIYSMTGVKWPLIGVFMCEPTAKMLVDLWNQWEAKTVVNFEGHKGVMEAVKDHLVGTEDMVEVSLTTTYVRGRVFHHLSIKAEKKL